MTYDPTTGSTTGAHSATSTATIDSSADLSVDSSVDDGAGRTEQAKSAAKDVASSAKEQGQHTVEVATGELRTVAAEVSTQARDLMGELLTQVNEQTGAQKTRLAEALRTFTDELHQMAEAGGGTGTATELVRQIAAKAESLHAQLDQNEPSALLDQGRGVARRRPGSFLLGALVAGVVAGRLTRGAKAATSTPAASGPAASTGVAPVAPITAPPADLGATYGEQTFEPSTYESGFGAPTTPARPYAGGDLA